MISRITTALKSRRNELDGNEKGFTLIELLVVVIIIGILAAIAIPVYMGIQNNAKDSAVKQDLSSAKTAVIAYYTDNPTATTAPVLMTGLTTNGYTPSDGVTLTYGTAPTTGGTTFCITGTRTSGTKSFHVTDTSGVEDGACGAAATP
ncbi:type II secretion system protein [Cryobacterium tepidiphilum]|uniref:Prepilin-type N-terminal cleavage/methylation domain-containing protein n=1 Tax=Cryobacterium tepidiphilum TaxID=2486026 RepID=A0A3M8L1R3_9MICO|nr:prepilin-type N-terminal cleavage/methylation domain-containing protein [Cryobacterium tepidiphilum]RNE59215.1 prepilin-type N-terminal cleavage/methylation domain-containing protein [Cryobacterium tepidiphilum]